MSFIAENGQKKSDPPSDPAPRAMALQIDKRWSVLLKWDDGLAHQVDGFALKHVRRNGSRTAARRG
jgi:hypothetical protein